MHASIYTAVKLYITSVWIDSFDIIRYMHSIASGSMAISTNSSAAFRGLRFRHAIAPSPRRMSAPRMMCMYRDASVVISAKFLNSNT